MHAFPFNACVARPVDRNERLRTPAAVEAMKKEWDRLRACRDGKGCWDEDAVRECADVLKEARAKGREVHVGRVFDICVEKHSELDVKHRKYHENYPWYSVV